MQRIGICNFTRGDILSHNFVCEIMELQRRVQTLQDEYNPHVVDDSEYDLEDNAEYNDSSFCKNSDVSDNN